jgi:hypothetical protein
MRHFFAVAVVLLAFISCHSPSRRDTGYRSGKVISHESARASAVYLTTDTSGLPVINWCETDTTGTKHLFISFFDAGRRRFREAIPVPIDQQASLHEEGMPKLAVKGDGTMMIIYEVAAPSAQNKFAGSVNYIQSFDGGYTWTRPAYVHQDTIAGKSRSFASIVRLNNGELGACWLDAAIDVKKAGRPVKFATTAGRAGFSNEVLIDSVACECCRTAIATGADGNISVVYRDILPDSIRDISWSVSTDHGLHFSKPISFSADQWKLAGCPHNGPSIVAVDGLNYTTWFTGGPSKGVYYAALNTEGTIRVRRKVNTNGRYIQLSMLGSGDRIAAYNETVHEKDSVYNKIVVQKISDNGAWKLDMSGLLSDGSFPVIQGYGADEFVVAWTGNGQVYYAVAHGSDVNGDIMDATDFTMERKLMQTGAGSDPYPHH